MREQPAQVAVAFAGAHQHREDRAVVHGQFSADDGADALFAGGVEDPRRAVESHPVAHRQSRQSETGSSAGQFFGQRGSTQEAEGAAGVQFDVGGTGGSGGHRASCSVEHGVDGPTVGLADQSQDLPAQGGGVPFLALPSAGFPPAPGGAPGAERHHQPTLGDRAVDR